MRPLTPGEPQRKSETYRLPDTFLGRVQRATIQTVDTKRGVCSLEMESTPGERTDVTVPLQYFSLPGPSKRNQAAWKRYMPQVGDIVTVGFDTNSSVRILGYDVVSYELIALLKEEENFAEFSELRSGEFDERSAGGAYLKGDRLGNLFLAGGLHSIKLDKKKREIVEQTSLEKLKAGSSTFRRGVVRRSPIPFFPELEAKPLIGVPPISTPVNAFLPSLYESTIDLRAPLAGLPFGRPVAFSSLGNVMDPDVDEIGLGAWGVAGPLGIKKFLLTGMNGRFLFRVYDSVPVTDIPIGTPGPLGGTLFRPFEIGIDSLGNLIINQGQGAVQGTIWWSPVKWDLWSTLVQINSVITRIGNPVTAIEPVVCGLLFSAATTAYLTAQFVFTAATGAYSGAVAAYNSVVAASFAASQPAGTIPAANATAVASAALAFVAAQGTYAAAVTAYTVATTAYNVAVIGSLSLSVFVSKIPLPVPPVTIPSLFQI